MHNSEFLRSRKCSLRVTVREKALCSIILSLSKGWPICSCGRTCNFQAVQIFIVLQDMTLEYLSVSYLPHLLSWGMHFIIVALALKILVYCSQALKGWPAQADIIDLSSTISISVASESQAGVGSHWEQWDVGSLLVNRYIHLTWYLKRMAEVFPTRNVQSEPHFSPCNNVVNMY